MNFRMISKNMLIIIMFNIKSQN